jgi:inorganic pyrophosphatase
MDYKVMVIPPGVFGGEGTRYRGEGLPTQGDEIDVFEIEDAEPVPGTTYRVRVMAVDDDRGRITAEPL